MKTLEQFDFSFQPGIDRKVVRELAGLAFIERSENVILLGPPRGKTHLAVAQLGIDPLYVTLPSYVVIMGGGALINLGYCLVRLAIKPELSVRADFSRAKPLLLANLLFSLLGGAMWYLQFFFYAWGHARISGQYDFISWMLHMNFYVLCGGLVGLLLKEWNNAGRRPVAVLSVGLGMAD